MMDMDYIEGLRTEHSEAMREQHLIQNAMQREHRSNMDDYPEFHYG